jgi:transcriptional regulator with XRE-family HTH domain
MVEYVHNFSTILREITTNLGIKDVDLAVGIGVTPATVSNWKNSKSIPYEKDIKRLSKYLLLELESQNLQIEHIDKCLNDTESKITESNLKNIRAAKTHGKYSFALFLILSSLCNADRKNKSIKATSNINGIKENKNDSENNMADTGTLISCNETTEMVKIISFKSKMKISVLVISIIVFCTVILSFVIPAITQSTTVSLSTTAFAWNGNNHENLATTGIQIALDNPLSNDPNYFKNLYDLKNNSDEQLVLKFGYAFADIQARATDNEFGRYFCYSYPYGKTSLHGGFKNSNYMSCYIYITNVAVKLGKGETPEKASATNIPGLSNNDIQALNDYFAYDRVGGSEWKNIFRKIGIYTENLDPTILRKYKKIFVFGLALHCATDVFSHSAFEQRSKNNWTQISHNCDDGINKSLPNADNPYYVLGCNINNHIENGYSDRYYAAEQIARKVMARYAQGTDGTIFDFGVPTIYIEDKNFKIGNYCSYAKAAGSSSLYSKYEWNFEVGNYTIK